MLVSNPNAQNISKFNILRANQRPRTEEQIAEFLEVWQLFDGEMTHDDMTTEEMEEFEEWKELQRLKRIYNISHKIV